MKKLIAIAALVLAVAGAYAQGTVNFVNKTSGGIDAPVFDVDGTTKLAGAGFLAGLYEGESLVGAAVPFRTGTGAGYWNPAPSGARTLTAAPGASVALTVRAWDASAGATYAAALAAGGKVGKSAAVTVTAGGAGDPPSLPSDLTGLKSFSLVAVPEPSTIALAAIGAAALLYRRRK